MDNDDHRKPSGGSEKAPNKRAGWEPWKGRAGKNPPRWGKPSRPRGQRGGGAPDLPEGRVVLYGWHPVVEALRNSERHALRLMATENALRRLEEALGTLPLQPEIVAANEISRLLEPDAVHQGLYLEAEHLDTPTLDTLPDDALVLALDQITDPHNVGAIVRTAAAFGVTAILTTARHSPTLGAEGKGLRQRTRDNCDVVARLDLPGAIKSLNVSNAAAIALFAVASAKG
jgi:23S rRNA (guanosine2251-2'-O)-methyltransferase